MSDNPHAAYEHEKQHHEEASRMLVLYEIDVDNSETYWVAAYGIFQAIEVFRAVEPDDSELNELSIEQVDEQRARAKNFRDDDGTSCTMWEEFQRQTAPCLVASTLF